MTDYPIYQFTQDEILESELENFPTEKYFPSSSEVLISEASAPIKSSDFQVSVKSSEIIKPDEISAELIESPRFDFTDIFDKIIPSQVISPINNFVDSVQTVTNNYLDKSESIINSSEKLVKDSLISIFEKSSTVSTSLVEETSSILNDLSSIVETKSTELSDRASSLISSTNSSILSESSILDIFNKAEVFDKESSFVNEIYQGSQEMPSSVNLMNTSNIEANTSNDVNNDSAVYLKNNKIIESTDIKNILEPDRTLEKSVNVLTKTLPEAVNNLSTSFTSISPATTTNSSSFVEGAKIDQSTSTVFNQLAPNQMQQSTTDKIEKSTDNRHELTEHYLQAIYAMLMSGKIKVKLEY